MFQCGFGPYEIELKHECGMDCFWNTYTNIYGDDIDNDMMVFEDFNTYMYIYILTVSL